MVQYIIFFQLLRLKAKIKDNKHYCPLQLLVTKYQGPTNYLEKAFAPLLKQLLPSSIFTNPTIDFIKNSTISKSLKIAYKQVSLHQSIDKLEVAKNIEPCIYNEEAFHLPIKNTNDLNLIISITFLY